LESTLGCHDFFHPVASAPVTFAQMEPTAQAKQARIAVSAYFLVFGLLVGSWLPHIPTVRAQIGCSEDALGQALLCSGLGAVASMQTMGAAIHRFGTAKVCLVSALIACITVPWLVLHQSIYTLGAHLLLVGIAYGALDVAMNAHAIEVQNLYPKSILATTHGFFSAGGIFGGFAASATTKAHIAPVIHMGVTASLLLVATLIAYPKLLPKSFDRNEDGPHFVVPKGGLLVLALICAAAFFAEEGVMTWSALYVRDFLKATPEFAGIITGCSALAMTAGRFLGDFILQRFTNKQVIALGGMACFAGVFLASQVRDPWFAIGAFAIACLGLSNVVPAVFREAGNSSEVSTGVGLAAVTTGGYAGFLLGPPLIGMISARTNLAVGMVVISVLGIMMASGVFGRTFAPKAPESH